MNDACAVEDGLRLVCHDLRQPVAGVLALAGAALAEAGVPERMRIRLEQIVALAEWQADVLEHWLQVSGADAPDEDANVVRVVNEAAAAERVTWTGELTFVWPSEPMFAGLHPIVLRRMAANLLANATRAAGPSGRVIIEVLRRPSRILLVVEDNGPGFGCLPEGFGLGLFDVARQALACQGRLECGRGDLGGGRVSLWLPVSASALAGRMADAPRVV